MRTSMTSKPSQPHDDRPRATHARPRSILLGSVTLGGDRRPVGLAHHTSEQLRRVGCVSGQERY